MPTLAVFQLEVERGGGNQMKLLEAENPSLNILD
jgi:hypothetical protein